MKEVTFALEKCDTIYKDGNEKQTPKDVCERCSLKEDCEQWIKEKRKK